MRLIVLMWMCLLFAAGAHAKTYSIKAGPNAEADTLAAFSAAGSGDSIRFGDGRFELSQTLRLAGDDIEIRGRGPEKTVLTFSAFAGEGDAISVDGAKISLRGFSVAEAKGVGVAVSGRDLWMEDVAVRGALGPGVLLAGVDGAIVQRSVVEGAMVGFDLRNSTRIELIDNLARSNGVGVLVENRPGAPAGGQIRLIRNRVEGNSGQGVGVDLVAAQNVALLQNDIGEHGTANIFIRAFPGDAPDPAFNALSTNITIRANTFGRAGFAPAPDWAPATANGAQFADIVWDGARSYFAGGAPRNTPVLLAIEDNTTTDKSAPRYLSLGLEAAGAPASEANPSSAWPPVARFAPPERIRLD